MCFIGCTNPPVGTWPVKPYTIVTQTPVIREKPYLAVDAVGNYKVLVPELKHNITGPSTLSTTSSPLDISQFLIAKPTNSADTMNHALETGHLILTPGIYHLNKSLHVRRAGTVILGLGMATLISDTGVPAIVVDDVGGVSICGIIVDANPGQTQSLITIGSFGSTTSHSSNPTALFDVSCRVGGFVSGSTNNCLTVHQSCVIMDNVWIWRADHGLPNTVGWTTNPSQNGLTVNGSDVTAYGLFVEHFQEYQTLWNGPRGQVFFYQSEIPYDPPDQAHWKQSTGENGFPSYKVASTVTEHTAKGVGVYCNFYNKVVLDNAIETPTAPGIHMNHLVTIWLSGSPGSAINHIINGRGDLVSGSKATLD
jgi:hypothetical protein